jgi:hypothetical protein
MNDACPLLTFRIKQFARNRGRPMRTASSETPDSLITALLRALEPASASDPPDNDSASVPKTVTQTLSVERLAAIAAMLATAPSIVAVVPPGVTKGRIAALLSPDDGATPGR